MKNVLLAILSICFLGNIFDLNAQNHSICGRIIDRTNSSLPYASITMKCNNIYPDKYVRGFITHKEDFRNLWVAFEKVDVSKEYEFLMYWTRKHYTNFFSRLFSLAMPKTIVMVCKKGTYDSHYNYKLPRKGTIHSSISVLNVIDYSIPVIMK